MKSKPRLGRGIESLLGSASTTGGFVSTDQASVEVSTFSPSPVSESLETPKVPKEKRIWSLPIEKLSPSADQPRKTFTKETISELAASVKKHGILQPILARTLEEGKSFEIIAGERRWRAAQVAGLADVPVILRETADQEKLELALIENIQREDLNPVDEAMAYDFLLKNYKVTQQDLADSLGIQRAKPCGQAADFEFGKACLGKS